MTVEPTPRPLSCAPPRDLRGDNEATGTLRCCVLREYCRWPCCAPAPSEPVRESTAASIPPNGRSAPCHRFPPGAAAVRRAGRAADGGLVLATPEARGRLPQRANGQRAAHPPSACAAISRKVDRVNLMVDFEWRRPHRLRLHRRLDGGIADSVITTRTSSTTTGTETGATRSARTQKAGLSRCSSPGISRRCRAPRATSARCGSTSTASSVRPASARPGRRRASSGRDSCRTSARSR